MSEYLGSPFTLPSNSLVTVDKTLNPNSLNPVQNRVVCKAVSDLRTAIDHLTPSGSFVFVDEEINAESTNPVQNKVIAAALEALSTRIAVLEDYISSLEQVHLSMTDGATTQSFNILHKP